MLCVVPGHMLCVVPVRLCLHLQTNLKLHCQREYMITKFHVASSLIDATKILCHVEILPGALSFSAVRYSFLSACCLCG
jgi:hypothetical protein